MDDVGKEVVVLEPVIDVNLLVVDRKSTVNYAPFL